MKFGKYGGLALCVVIGLGYSLYKNRNDLGLDSLGLAGLLSSVAPEDWARYCQVLHAEQALVTRYSLEEYELAKDVMEAPPTLASAARAYIDSAAGCACATRADGDRAETLDKLDSTLGKAADDLEAVSKAYADLAAMELSPEKDDALVMTLLLERQMAQVSTASQTTASRLSTAAQNPTDQGAFRAVDAIARQGATLRQTMGTGFRRGAEDLGLAMMHEALLSASSGEGAANCAP